MYNNTIQCHSLYVYTFNDKILYKKICKKKLKIFVAIILDGACCCRQFREYL